MGFSGLKVSVAGLGTMNFSNKEWGCDEKKSREIIDSFIDKGGNFIDTASTYNSGESERILGKAIKGKKRDELVISTKCGDLTPDAALSRRGSSRTNITDSLAGSLKRLGTDYIDLFYLHIWDPTTPLSESIETLSGLVKKGLIRYIGVSNYSGWQISEAACCSKNSCCSERIASVQNEYSLIRRYAEYEAIPSCIYNKIGFVCYSPLGGGALSGKYMEGRSHPKGARYALNADWSKAQKGRYLSGRNMEIIREADNIARELGDVSLPALALAWCIKKPAVTSVLIGANRISHLEDNMKAADIDLSDEVMKKLDDASSFFTPFEYSGLQDYVEGDVFGVVDYQKF
jgi:aryl-alcohol dehydrogenase-like predicted oxidoreductase